MDVLARHRLAAVIVAVAFALTAGFFAVARPQYRPPNQGEQIKVPRGLPAAEATGAAGWVWPAGVPGWEPGQMLGHHHDFNISGVQPVEVAAAQLAAARAGLDAAGVRVLVSLRPSRNGALAILATRALYESPARTCIAAVLLGDTPVHWQCPSWSRSPLDLDHARVVVSATVMAWPGGKHSLDLVGVARGDVRRVVLDVPGRRGQELYRRGDSWGQFETAVTTTRDGGNLLVYDKHGLAETVPLRLRPGAQRVLR